MKKIIIDTDIGDDIDDAYAIAFAVKLKKFELQGITTVYRNSLQRAKIASALLSVLGVGEKQVCVGEDYPPNCKFAIESFEEVLPDGRPVIPHYRDEFASAPVSSKRAAEFIAEQAEKYPGEITVIAIGPMTNLAEVAEKYQRSYKKLAKIGISAAIPNPRRRCWAAAFPSLLWGWTLRRIPILRPRTWRRSPPLAERKQRCLPGCLKNGCRRIPGECLPCTMRSPWRKRRIADSVVTKKRRSGSRSLGKNVLIRRNPKRESTCGLPCRWTAKNFSAVSNRRWNKTEGGKG